MSAKGDGCLCSCNNNVITIIMRDKSHIKPPGFFPRGKEGDEGRVRKLFSVFFFFFGYVLESLNFEGSA